MALIEKLLVASTLMVELIEREVICDPEPRYIFLDYTIRLSIILIILLQMTVRKYEEKKGGEN